MYLIRYDYTFESNRVQSVCYHYCTFKKDLYEFTLGKWSSYNCTVNSILHLLIYCHVNYIIKYH